MTAIGLLLLLISYIAYLANKHSSEDIAWLEAIHCGGSCAGWLLFLAGVFTFIWRAMP